MNIEEKKQLNEESPDLMCVSCKRFFGCQAFKMMCSQCYKSNATFITPKKEETKQPQVDASLNTEREKAEPEKQEVNKDKCAKCSRKLRLLGVQCRCGLFYCNGHRLPEDHACSFNHRNAGKEKLTKQIIKVQNGKIESI